MIAENVDIVVFFKMDTREIPATVKGVGRNVIGHVVFGH